MKMLKKTSNKLNFPTYSGKSIEKPCLVTMLPINTGCTEKVVCSDQFRGIFVTVAPLVARTMDYEAGYRYERKFPMT